MEKAYYNPFDRQKKGMHFAMQALLEASMIESTSLFFHSGGIYINTILEPFRMKKNE